MAEKIRWGILSTANIGKRRVIPAIQQSSNGEVVAVASRSLEKAQAFAKEAGIPTAYGSYEELILSSDIDAIYIPLPNSEHAAWSIHCAEAGVPTLCEKPFASNAAEAQKMVNVFSERGVLFAEAFMYRFHPQTEKVKAMIEEGAVGQIKAISASFTFGIRSEDNIRLSKELAGGGLMDVGCYCINVMRYMTGEEPDSGQAIAHIGEQSGVDEALAALLSFPSGVMGHLDCGLRMYRTHTYEIRGTEGRIQVDQGFTMEANAESVIKWWHGDDYTQITIPPANHYTLMVEDFANAILSNHSPRFHPQDAVENMRVIDMLLSSI